MFRNTLVRSFHTTPVARKTLADNAREVADKVCAAAAAMMQLC